MLCGDEWVFRYYWGDVYAVLPERLPVPMFKFQGLIKAKWTNNGKPSERYAKPTAFS